MACPRSVVLDASVWVSEVFPLFPLGQIRCNEAMERAFIATEELQHTAMQLRTCPPPVLARCGGGCWILQSVWLDCKLSKRPLSCRPCSSYPPANVRELPANVWG